MVDAALTDFYIYLPAFIANAAPVVAKHLPGLRTWSTPVWPSVMGTHKTWRGLLTGIAAAAMIAMLQFGIEQWPSVLGTVMLHKSSLLLSGLIGCLLGFGALLGDMLKSIVKRRIGIPPGKALPYFDGVDYVLGAMFVLLPWHTPSWPGVVLLLVIAPLASLAANIGAYCIGWKKQWY
jgi:CDP-2,3-bis-(O-geranylgeranyl)-sn-glycerol synthase